MIRELRHRSATLTNVSMSACTLTAEAEVNSEDIHQKNGDTQKLVEK
jgi:hypothetical protein